MNLIEYINSFPKIERKKTRLMIAKSLGISDRYIYSMCNGNKRIPEKYAVGIEKATEGKVRRQDICPHMYE